jgi:hypothetical protein
VIVVVVFTFVSANTSGAEAHIRVKATAPTPTNLEINTFIAVLLTTSLTTTTGFSGTVPGPSRNASQTSRDVLYLARTILANSLHAFLGNFALFVKLSGHSKSINSNDLPPPKQNCAVKIWPICYMGLMKGTT